MSWAVLEIVLWGRLIAAGTDIEEAEHFDMVEAFILVTLSSIAR